MEYAAICHNGDNKYCYALEKDQFLFKIQVKKDNEQRDILQYKGMKELTKEMTFTGHLEQ